MRSTLGGYNRRTLIAAIFAAIVVALSSSVFRAEAQSNSSESPYTRFGLGSLSQQSLTANRGMGGIGYGLRMKTTANPMNPASYTAVDSATFIFDLGVSAGLAWYSDTDNASRRNIGNIEYATMLFRLNKYIGMSAGILPYAYSGYQFGSVEPIGGQSAAKYSRLYYGEGNLNQVYVGVAARPTEGLSVGINAGFLFGSFEQTRTVRYDTPSALSPVLRSDLSLRGFKPEIGLQYTLGLSNGQSLTLGATYAPQMNLHSTLKTLSLQGSSNKATQVEYADTIRGTNLYSLPHIMALGLSYAMSDKLLLGADIQYSKWGTALYDKAVSKYQDRWRVAMGGQYVPNPTERSFFKRLGYRFGINGSNSYLQVPTAEGFKGYYQAGISAGLDIPMVDRRSTLHLSLEYDRLIPTTKAMVNEQYLRLTVGVSFNESWFRKPKID